MFHITENAYVSYLNETFCLVFWRKKIKVVNLQFYTLVHNFFSEFVKIILETINFRWAIFFNSICDLTIYQKSQLSINKWEKTPITSQTKMPLKSFTSIVSLWDVNCSKYSFWFFIFEKSVNKKYAPLPNHHKVFSSSPCNYTKLKTIIDFPPLCSALGCSRLTISIG